jgi:hypothetical protein
MLEARSNNMGHHDGCGDRLERLEGPFAQLATLATFIGALVMNIEDLGTEHAVSSCQARHSQLLSFNTHCYQVVIGCKMFIHRLSALLWLKAQEAVNTNFKEFIALAIVLGDNGSPFSMHTCHITVSSRHTCHTTNMCNVPLTVPTMWHRTNTACLGRIAHIWMLQPWYLR